MSELLRTILIMSLSGSVVAVLLFALKPLVRDRLPKFAQYYLWLVVIAALLVPISKLVVFPETDSGPLPVAPIQSVVERSVFADAQIRPRPGSVIPMEPSELLEGATHGEKVVMPRLYDTLAPVFTFTYPFGAAATLLYFLMSYTIFTGLHRRRNRAANAEETAQLRELCGSRRAPRLYRNPLAATPMLFGVFRPAIILPDREYTAEQLRAVLLHELTHLRRKDILVKWLSVIACAVHWFNPIVWFVRREIDRACELACDESVVRNLDEDGKQNYGETLLYVAADSKTPRAVLSTTMCEEKKALKERLGAILKNKKHTRAAILVSVVLICAVGGVAVALGAGRENKADFPVATISYNGKSAVITLGDKENIPYVELGSTVSIDFGNARPAHIAVIEVIANADGSRKYAEQTDRALDVDLSGSNLATFNIEKNNGDMLSSDFDDYLPGNAWRWYRINCNNDGRSVTEYSLWVRTDPAIIMNPTNVLPSTEKSNDGVITLDKLRALAAKGDTLKASDLPNLRPSLLSSRMGGYNPTVYGVEGGYRLAISFNDTMNPDSGIKSMSLESIWDNGGSGIDIRYSDVDEFIRTHPSHPADVVPSTTFEPRKWVDFYRSEEMPWTTAYDLMLDEFPGVLFSWTSKKVTAGADTVIDGMPVWNVYLADLNGDNLPELCATVSFGSGIADDRIVVYDYANGKRYQLAERMVRDFRLLLKNGRLVVSSHDSLYRNSIDPPTVGSIAIVNGELVYTVEGELPIPPSVPPSAPVSVDKPAVFGRFIRTGWSEGENKVVVLHSAREFADFYKASRLDEQLDTGWDGDIAFSYTLEKYDEAFFKDNILVLAGVSEGSGSIRHEFTGVVYDGDTAHLQVRRIVPEVGTDDMAYWYLVAPFARTEVQSINKFVLDIQAAP